MTPTCRACGFPMSARNVLDDASPRYCPNINCASFNQGSRMAARLQRGDMPGLDEPINWRRFALTNFVIGFALWLAFVLLWGVVIGFWEAIASAVVFGGAATMSSILEQRIHRGKW